MRLGASAPRLLRAILAALVLAPNVRGNVTVVTQLLSLEEFHVLVVNNSIEYILQFVPSGEQGLWPSRLWVSAEGGDAVRPLLLTARQKSGATTWQLPYESGEQLHHEFQRTLCADDAADGGSADCGEEVERASGEFSLHVGTSCAAPVRVQLRVEPARDWRLSDQWAAHVVATHRAPSVHHYRFAEGQDSVRLTISSDDDFCATVSIQNYTCPIVQTLAGIEMDTLRMTVQRSGGVQLSRKRFPRGFYVVTIVHATDEACSGSPVPQPDDDWLWEAAVGAAAEGGGARPAAPAPAPAPPRLKRLRYEVKASLSVQQYVVAVVVTTVVFVGFYVAFGLLVVLRRWPSWNALVAPKAVLAQPQGAEAEAGVASEGDSTVVADTPARPRRRRDSNATFDSSDNSDTDSEEERGAGATPPSPPSPPPPSHGAHLNGHSAADDGQAAATHTEQVRPFGLPARLRVAALARRRGRVLRARTDRYLYTLSTVAVFYALPVIQFVAAFQIVMNRSGSLDLCYYNFLCAQPAGAVSDFNHVFSNVGYLLLGALFMLQLRRRSARRQRKPRDEEYGIPAHYGLLASLGAGMMVVALLSASYHVCPNRLNFQFDTAFMYVLAVLLMVKIYQARHPDVNARAHATFAVLALLIALVVWGVLGGGPLFWSIFTVLHVFTFLLLSLRIYYVGQFRLEKASLAVAARELAARRPLYTPRLVMLLIANAANWAFALYGLFTQTGDIASHLLSVLLCNALLYIVFYLTMKLLHGERPRWYAWCYLAAAAAAWVPALYFFTSGSTNWAATAAQSRHLNHECLLLHFYDSHDLWHVLSAVALYFTFNLMLTWDDGLAAVRRTDIAVF